MDTKYFCIKMTASVMHMEIPKKFATNLKGRVCDGVKLKGPSGITWQVKMRKSKDTFIFQNGWKDFVTANKIGENDILLFMNCGNSSFEVSIFDPSGSEKVASFFAEKTLTEVHSQESSDTSVRVVNEPRRMVQRDFTCITSGSDETSYEISSDSGRLCTTGKLFIGDRGTSDDEVDFRTISQKKKRAYLKSEKSTNRGSSRHITDKVMQDQFKKPDSQIKMRKKSGSPNERNELIKSPYIVPARVSLTSAQEEIALKMSCNAQQGNPTFIRLLTLSNLSRGKTCQINFPVNFAASLKETKNQKIILRCHGKDKEWNARYFSSNSGGICGVGLSDFILQNKLNKGDLCLFELMENEPKLTVTVHVFRI